MLSRMEQLKVVQEKFDVFFDRKKIHKQIYKNGWKLTADHPVVQTFRECMFYELDGKLVADLNENYSFALLYNEDPFSLREQLLFLGFHLGIQFDPATDFTRKLVISSHESIQALRDAGVVVDKPAPIMNVVPANPGLFAQSSIVRRPLDPSIFQKASEEIKTKIDELDGRMEKLHKKLKAQQLLLEIFKSLANGDKARLGGDTKEKHILESNNVIGEQQQPIIDAFYELHALIYAKFHTHLNAQWDPAIDNAITVELTTPHRITREIHKASHFLHLFGSRPFSLARPGYSDTGLGHTLTLQQCHAAITALKLLNDVTPDEIKEIQSRPAMRC